MVICINWKDLYKWSCAEARVATTIIITVTFILFNKTIIFYNHPLTDLKKNGLQEKEIL